MFDPFLPNRCLCDIGKSGVMAGFLKVSAECRERFGHVIFQDRAVLNVFGCFDVAPLILPAVPAVAVYRSMPDRHQ